MKPNNIKQSLTKEINFYDQQYFNEGRKHPTIEMYYSGHGLPEKLMLSSTEGLKYEELFEILCSKIEERMKSLDYSQFPKDLIKFFKNQKQGVEWFVNVFLDACHSGSALYSGE